MLHVKHFRLNFVSHSFTWGLADRRFRNISPLTKARFRSGGASGRSAVSKTAASASMISSIAMPRIDLFDQQHVARTHEGAGTAARQRRRCRRQARQAGGRGGVPPSGASARDAAAASTVLIAAALAGPTATQASGRAR